MSLFPVIRCAICEKEVDVIEWFDNHKTGGRIITVKCHGAIDQMILTPAFMEQFRGVSTMRGVAFKQRLIETTENKPE